MDRRDLDVLVRSSPESAFAAIVTHGRAPTVPLVLLLYEPGSLANVPGMGRALGRYAPHAICWAYSKDSDPSLYAADTGVLFGSQRARPSTHPPRRRPAVRVRIPAPRRVETDVSAPLLFPVDPDPDGLTQIAKPGDTTGRLLNLVSPVSPSFRDDRPRLPVLSQRLAVSDEEIAMLLGREEEKKRME